MVFDPKMRRRMETSFPSKLVEFAQFGKLIVVWGPEYCTAVRWAVGKDSSQMTFYNIKSSAADVMATLENVAMKRNTKHGLAGLLDPCEWLEFEPKQIRSDFIQRVEQLRQAAS